MAQTVSNRKNLQIETLRGFAILLVVVGHVIGSTPEGGMKIDFPSFWRYLYLYIDYLQMPLFTAIAGWVYGLKLYSDKPLIPFVKGKFIRLILPMAVVGTLYFVVQYFTPGTNNKGDLWDIWRIYVFPYTLYWYLPSLFFMFLIQFVADRLGFARGLKGYALFFLTAYAVASLVKGWSAIDALPNLFSFKGALILFPYFLTGVMCSRLKELCQSVSLRYVALFCGLISVGLIQWNYFDLFAYPQWINSFLRPFLVCGVLIGLLNLNWNNRFFVWLGTYSYGIYLLHGFGTAGGRIVMSYLNIQQTEVVFVFALLVALFGSAWATSVLQKNKWSALLFLGVRRE